MGRGCILLVLVSGTTPVMVCLCVSVYVVCTVYYWDTDIQNSEAILTLPALHHMARASSCKD